MVVPVDDDKGVYLAEHGVNQWTTRFGADENAIAEQFEECAQVSKFNVKWKKDLC